MNAEKADFLHYKLISLLQEIPSDRVPSWGKMTLQQMIEHFSDSVRIASGKTVFADVITPQEHLQKIRDFVLSEKPFRENTANSLMPEIPAPVKNNSVINAVKELEEEIEYFFTVFEKDHLQVTRNPFFGDLNYAQNVHLLHKHAVHHLRQFSPLSPGVGT